MKIQNIYTLMAERGLTDSQRQFSKIWLERGSNYLSQNLQSDLSADDALTLWRGLQNEREYELASHILADLLEGQ
jgi:hypothetical protein